MKLHSFLYMITFCNLSGIYDNYQPLFSFIFDPLHVLERESKEIAFRILSTEIADLRHISATTMSHK